MSPISFKRRESTPTLDIAGTYTGLVRRGAAVMRVALTSVSGSYHQTGDGGRGLRSDAPR